LGADIDLYGYCLNDPINWIDPLGLGAGKRIMMSGVIGAGQGAIAGAVVGTPVLGVGAAPSALVGGIVGFSVGLLRGAIVEALGWGEPIEDFINEYIEAFDDVPLDMEIMLDIEPLIDGPQACQ
jgi:hypothetical protein